MRVAVVNAQHPFERGGAEILADALTSSLNQLGYQATLVGIPFAHGTFVELPNHLEIARSIDLSPYDKIISLKFPVYFAEHDDHVVWLLHQLRAAYELAGTDVDPIGNSDLGESVREYLKRQDTETLSLVKKLFTSSQVTHDRLLHNNGIESAILHHPIHDADLFVGGTPEPYIFAGGRLHSVKRQHLILEALAIAAPEVKLVLAGPADRGHYQAKIEKLAADLGLHDRLTLRLGYWPRSDIADWVNRSTSCIYVPFDEDSFGYFTMEAAHAAKPVITTTDSGGLLGLVRDHETGWVAEPTAEALADAMNEASASPQRSQEMGVAMRTMLDSYDVTWPNTIERLLA